ATGPTGSSAPGQTWAATGPLNLVRGEHYRISVELLLPEGPVQGTLEADLSEGDHPIWIHYEYSHPDSTHPIRPNDHLDAVAAGHAPPTTLLPRPTAPPHRQAGSRRGPATQHHQHLTPRRRPQHRNQGHGRRGSAWTCQQAASPCRAPTAIAIRRSCAQR